MKLRTYQGNSMAEALEKVKEDLGRDAVILHTRSVQRGGLWGVGARTIVEITASSDLRDLPADERRVLAGRDERAAESALGSNGNNSRTIPATQLAASREDRAGCSREDPDAVGASPPRAAARAIPPIQGYAYRPPESLRAMADRVAVASMPDAIEGQRAGGLATGRMIRPDQSVRQDFSVLAAGLRDEMNEIRSMVRELLSRPAIAHGRQPEPAPRSTGILPVIEPETPAELQEYYTRLLQSAVAEEVARDIIAKARDRLDDCRERIRAGVGDRVSDGVVDARIRAKLRELIPAIMMETVERMLPPPGPVQVEAPGTPKIVVLVGPTGVGKTTTIAKLAAHFKLREGRRVGLITTDTYRIAAVDQLRAYADIMSLRLEVVFTPEEFRRAIGRLAECDLILVDTSGRSHRDTQRLGELRAFLDAARAAVADGATPGRRARRVKSALRNDTNDLESKPSTPLAASQGERTRSFPAGLSVDALPAVASIEVHLLLSCTCDQAQLLQVAERFSTLGVDRVVFTKLDEAVGIGVVLNVASRLGVQLSYLTTGQDVPDDIEVGHRRRIAEMLLQGAREEVPQGPPADAQVVDQLV